VPATVCRLYPDMDIINHEQWNEHATTSLYPTCWVYSGHSYIYLSYSIYFINDGNDIMLRLCLYSTLKKIDVNHPTFPTIFSRRLTLIIRQFLPHFHVNHKPQFANFCLTENMHINDWLFRCFMVHNYIINAHDLLKLYNTIVKPSSTCTK